ncbi:hypothetical protein BJX70DRAFT_368904 [Aspergillus crustosus]
MLVKNIAYLGMAVAISVCSTVTNLSREGTTVNRAKSARATDPSSLPDTVYPRRQERPSIVVNRQERSIAPSPDVLSLELEGTTAN